MTVKKKSLRKVQNIGYMTILGFFSFLWATFYVAYKGEEWMFYPSLLTGAIFCLFCFVLFCCVIDELGDRRKGSKKKQEEDEE